MIDLAGFAIRARPNYVNDSIHLWVFRPSKDPERIDVISTISTRSQLVSEILTDESLVSLPSSSAQLLLDDLRACGIRPTSFREPTKPSKDDGVVSRLLSIIENLTRRE